jgi:hypothetical protein
MIDLEPGTDRATWEGPEEHDYFRAGQLLMLLAIAATAEVELSTIDRLTYLDFFSANPYAILDGADPEKDERDRLGLAMAGFASEQLRYGNVGSRFATRRSRIQYDLSALVSRGLARVGKEGYEITPHGREIANRLTSAYADAYRVGAATVIGRLARLSERALRRKVETLLGRSWLLIDFLADVHEATTAAKQGAN